jgi:dUTP pyrophosphatase
MKKRGFEKITEEQMLKDFYNETINLYCNANKFEYNNENMLAKAKDIKENIIKKPERGTAKSAGYDVYSPFDTELQPGDDIKLPTGIKAYMQPDEVLFVYPRSSLGFKYYCRLANTIGVIDSDYYNNKDNEGHIWVKLRNESDDKIMIIEQGEAICQVIFQKYLLADSDSFEGDERIGGFGSTNN